jgi:hypothetical protein
MEATTVGEAGLGERELAQSKDKAPSPDQGRRSSLPLRQGSVVSAATHEAEAASPARATRAFTRGVLLTLLLTEGAWFCFLTYLAVRTL